MMWYWLIGFVFAGAYLCWEYWQADKEMVLGHEEMCIAIVFFVFGGVFALAAFIFAVAIGTVKLLEMVPPVQIVIKKK